MYVVTLYILSGNRGTSVFDGKLVFVAIKDAIIELKKICRVNVLYMNLFRLNAHELLLKTTSPVRLDISAIYKKLLL